VNYRSFANTVKRKNRYIQDRDVEKFLCRVRAQFEDHATTLEQGSGIWRAALGCGQECVYFGRDEDGDPIIEAAVTPWGVKRLTPDPSKVTEGRANPRAIAYFYAASSKEIAIHEVRPWVGAEVTVKLFQLTKDVKIVDFCHTDGWEERRKIREPGLGRVFVDLARRPTEREFDEAIWDDVSLMLRHPDRITRCLHRYL